MLHPSATATGRRSPYVYFEDEPGRRAAAKLLTRHEAWRMSRPEGAEAET